MSSNDKIKVRIGAAFGLIIVLMVIIVLINTIFLRKAAQNMDHVVGVHNVQMSMMNQILDLARQRSLTLQEMLLNQDPFLFDDQVLRMSQIASKYLSLSQQLREMPLTDEEADLLDKQNTQSVHTGLLQGQIMKLIADGDYAAAKKVFYEQASQSQGSAMDLMSRFVVLQNTRIMRN